MIGTTGKDIKNKVRFIICGVLFFGDLIPTGEASGIYMVRFTAEAKDGSRSFVDSQKVTLLK